MFLVDTDVLSLLRRPERSPRIGRWMAAQRTADLYVSVVFEPTGAPVLDPSLPRA